MVKILVVDDHSIVFSGIDLLLKVDSRDYDLVHCINGKECISQLEKNVFELIILDVNLPDTDTIQLIEVILQANPKQKILIFSMSSEEVYAKRLLQLGVMGYLSKKSDNKEFFKAIDMVLSGQTYLSNFLKNMLATDVIQKKSIGNIFDRLTARELEIMKYFLAGYGSKEVANMTNLHSSTIGTHKLKIFEKLGVKNILELQDVAKIHGII